MVTRKLLNAIKNCRLPDDIEEKVRKINGLISEIYILEENLKKGLCEFSYKDDHKWHYFTMESAVNRINEIPNQLNILEEDVKIYIRDIYGVYLD